jgi:hypothetical protein
MADKVTPYAETHQMEQYLVLLELKNMITKMAADIQELKAVQMTNRQTIPIIDPDIIPEPVQDPWIIYNRNRLRFRLQISHLDNYKTKFKMLCCEFPEAFERHYIPEVGAKFTTYDDANFRKLSDAIFRHMKENNKEALHALQIELDNTFP